ncbi:unnamed protein product [Protopolystoma xenopodis]|uniref:Uncharacterized protein n=1 Tax=Protopolystoma xenopodis TaxID=117903 RepID=A0A3S4ZEN1_9PLAT|nr:unnamed protein product [Protopolystoma xenopodis]
MGIGRPLLNVMDMAKVVREKEIKKLNKEWESKLLRRHLRDKRRQATLQYQLEQMRSYLMGPTEEKKQEIMLENGFVFKYPSKAAITKGTLCNVVQWLTCREYTLQCHAASIAGGIDKTEAR